MAFKHHRSKPDKNFSEVVKAMKERRSGYWKEKKYPHHYAYLRGLHVCMYDTNKMGNGFPDCEIWVSWFCLQFEVKQERPPLTPEGTQGRNIQKILTDEQYYKAQLEPSEMFYRYHHSNLVPIVWDRSQVQAWMNTMADFVLYVEHKSEGSAPLLELFFPDAFRRLSESSETLPVAAPAPKRPSARTTKKKQH